MNIILTILLALLFMVTLREALGTFLGGGYINEHDLDLFLEKNLDTFHLNEFAYPTKHLSSRETGQYIVKWEHWSFIWKWKIIGSEDGATLIPVWSKWHKKLDRYYNSLPHPQIRNPNLR